MWKPIRLEALLSTFWSEWVSNGWLRGFQCTRGVDAPVVPPILTCLVLVRCIDNVRITGDDFPQVGVALEGMLMGSDAPLDDPRSPNLPSSNRPLRRAKIFDKGVDASTMQVGKEQRVRRESDELHSLVYSNESRNPMFLSRKGKTF